MRHKYFVINTQVEQRVRVVHFASIVQVGAFVVVGSQGLTLHKKIKSIYYIDFSEVHRNSLPSVLARAIFRNERMNCGGSS